MKPSRKGGFPLEPVLVALTAVACLLVAAQRLAG